MGNVVQSTLDPSGHDLALARRMKLLAIAVLALGCTQSSQDPFKPDTTEVSIARQGGLAPTPQAGSTCAPMDDRYTLSVATHVLAWQFCSAPASDGVYSFVSGQKSLGDADFEQLSTALHGLTPVQPSCGGDITDQIVFVSPSGQTTFDHANCLGNESAVFEVLDTVTN